MLDWMNTKSNTTQAAFGMLKYTMPTQHNGENCQELIFSSVTVIRQRWLLMKC